MEHLRDAPWDPACGAVPRAGEPSASLLWGRRNAPSQRECARQGLTGRGRQRQRQMSASGWGWQRQNFPNTGRQHAPTSPITYAATERGHGAPSTMPVLLRPPPRGLCTRRPGLSWRPRPRLGKLPDASCAAITLNGNAPPRSVLSPRPAWVGMEKATSPGLGGATPKRRRVVLGSSPAPRLPGFKRTPGCGGARA